VIVTEHLNKEVEILRNSWRKKKERKHRRNTRSGLRLAIKQKKLLTI